jgi:hypothetical protein
VEQVDIWSAGCIMAELMIRQPLFKGADYVKQVATGKAVGGRVDHFSGGLIGAH